MQKHFLSHLVSADQLNSTQPNYLISSLLHVSICFSPCYSLSIICPFPSFLFSVSNKFLSSINFTIFICFNVLSILLYFSFLAFFISCPFRGLGIISQICFLLYPDFTHCFVINYFNYLLIIYPFMDYLKSNLYSLPIFLSVIHNFLPPFSKFEWFRPDFSSQREKESVLIVHLLLTQCLPLLQMYARVHCIHCF